MKRHCTILFIALALVQFSCSSSNKSAVPCPDFSHSRNMKSRHAQIKYAYREPIERDQSKSARAFHPRFRDVTNDRGKNTTASLYSVPLSAISGIHMNVSWNYSNLKIAGVQQTSRVITPERIQEPLSVSETPIQQGCDTIVLRNGDVMQARVLEIGEREIRYRKCEDIEGPASLINLAEVFMIKYPNGTRDYFTSEKGPASTGNNAVPKKTHGMALSGFIGSLVGLFIFGIPLGIMAIVFGFISIGKIDKYPERYKGRGMALASIIIGAIDVIGMLILLAAM